MKKVFLGGTCNDSTWRDKLIKQLEIDYFNPHITERSEEMIRTIQLQSMEGDNI